MTYASGPGVDPETVRLGAMLHDIGRGVSHSIDHAQVGADICRASGLSETIARIVERHIGAGLTRDECRELGLEPRDCMPKTVEEKIVAHADNRVKGTDIITIEERLALTADLPETIRKRIRDLAEEVERIR
jgi:uncharacterized protein